MLTQIQARKRASELKKKLGSGWRIRVWENLGWNYAVFKMYPGNKVEVAPIEYRTRLIGYFAYLKELNEPSTQLLARGRTPAEVIRNLFKETKKVTEGYIGILEEIRDLSKL